MFPGLSHMHPGTEFDHNDKPDREFVRPVVWSVLSVNWYMDEMVIYFFLSTLKISTKKLDRFSLT